MRPVHAVVLPPGPELRHAVAEALDGGPAVLPLNPGSPAPALRGLLTALRPTHLRDEDGVRPLRGGAGVPAEIAVVIATSGSTGVPKGVQLSAHALRASAAASLARLGATPGERWLCCLPISHVAGLQVLVRALLSGSEPIVHEGFDPGAVAASGADRVSLVPTQLRRMIDLGYDLSGFRSILLGGAPAPPGLLAEAAGRGARVVTTYGMSETCGGCVYDGLPLDGVDLDLDPLGRIRIAGEVLFSGYRDPAAPYGAPGESPGKWFTTSDLGVFEGGRLRVLGRADHVINTGGEKVVAETVAAVLGTHPDVRDVVVVGRPDPEWGERVVAVVVPRDPAAPPVLAALREHVKERLPGHAAPRELRLVDAVPSLPSGKPDLEALRRA
ncbi:AMP-binding protein [Rhizohabitans arisaemae]|uniref:AMP-binding protein n=1 Tax=Rhizohabitans arisaemae TaxID=2720610 RepID=UPI0024B044A4|nr:AMP-binding protein [Rhizohabitans arisaemae]